MQQGSDQPAGSGTFIEAARRAQLIETAISTIAELGYAKASFVRIAERAGISPGLITYHFGTKARLMAEVVRTVEFDLERRLEARADGADDHLGALRALIEGYVAYCAEHPERLIAVGRIEDNEGTGADRRDQSVGEFEELLREGQRSGDFREFATRPVAVALLAALESVPAELAARPDTDVPAFADALAAVFERAVRGVGPVARRRSRREA